MENTTKELGWSHGREADPFSRRQRLALSVGMLGILTALVAALVTAGTPHPFPLPARAGRGQTAAELRSVTLAPRSGERAGVRGLATAEVRS
jgi:hypothetical protein